MMTKTDVKSWSPAQVVQWLEGIKDDSSWLNSDLILENRIGGLELLSMTPGDLRRIGITKVDLQEHIMEAIERLQNFTYCLTQETLQMWFLRLGCNCKSLQQRLARFEEISAIERDADCNKMSMQSFNSKDPSSAMARQRISLDTLTGVSQIVATVCHIIDILSHSPFSKLSDYRSMKSLLLDTSIELTSTAQRDQFVEKPNDIIWIRSKFLADYSDRIVRGSRDPLLIQPSSLERVEIESINGLVLKSLPESNKHIIEKIRTSSSAKRSNKLDEGDEVLQFNQLVVGWAAVNFDNLVNNVAHGSRISMTVKKPIRD